MISEIARIAQFIWGNIIHIWPYLLITVPIAVAVNITGASKHIGKVFNKRPVTSIILATIVGAMSPFCSCSVIPIIASLLIGGVPLAPVMSFWLASPSMDPETFFLSVSIIGWNLAIWRLGGAFVMSLGAGFITHWIVSKGLIKEDATLKAFNYSGKKKTIPSLRLVFNKIKDSLINMPFFGKRRNVILATATNVSCCVNNIELRKEIFDEPKLSCCSETKPIKKEESKFALSDKGKCKCEAKKKNDFANKLTKEITKATLMVFKFMLLAYFMEALIIFYIPSEYVKATLGSNGIMSVIWAALIGIPVYTSTIPALAMVGGLISQGMTEAAGLAFLIAGPTTTIPAMAAVWNLANKKVFFLYIGFTLLGAIASGMFYYLLT